MFTAVNRLLRFEKNKHIIGKSEVGGIAIYYCQKHTKMFRYNEFFPFKQARSRWPSGRLIHYREVVG